MTTKPTIEQLEAEIKKIAQFIADAKREIIAISLPAEKTGNDKNLLNAALELSEVVRHTEEATNTIMDKVDALLLLANEVTDAQVAAKITEHGTGILEACSFQDITGQRINKVMSTLEQIELRVGRLVKRLGGDMDDVGPIEAIVTKPRRADEDLLNGPQMGKDTQSQEDIDKLFGSL